MMPTSDKVKAVLNLCGKKQIDLAAYFGMSKQTMSNKMARDSWSAADFGESRQAFVGGKVAFMLPDGQHIYLEKEESEEKE